MTAPARTIAQGTRDGVEGRSTRRRFCRPRSGWRFTCSGRAFRHCGTGWRDLPLILDGKVNDHRRYRQADGDQPDRAVGAGGVEYPPAQPDSEKASTWWERNTNPNMVVK